MHSLLVGVSGLFYTKFNLQYQFNFECLKLMKTLQIFQCNCRLLLRIYTDQWTYYQFDHKPNLIHSILNFQ